MPRHAYRVFAAVLVASLLTLTGALPAQASSRVSIVNYKYKPAKVTISKGTKVVWHNATTATLHSVTAYRGSWSKDTTVSAGSGTSFTFKKPGTFRFYCKFHAHITASGKCVADTGIPTPMCGTVVVS
jgi:plastocyanin